MQYHLSQSYLMSYNMILVPEISALNYACGIKIQNHMHMSSSGNYNML